MPIADSTYAPPPWLDGGHRQTLYASLVRRVDLEYDRRERLDTPDDDFLDLDWARAGASPSDRAVVLTHGLEGSAGRGYMRGMAQAFVRRGWDACALNLRGCSGTPNRQVATYHSGKTDDLALVVDHVLDQGYTSVALIGFSLGGNLTLKYLGERGSQVDDRIRGAVALSTPVDLDASADRIDRWSNWHYVQYFLRSLRHKMRVKAEQHPARVSAAPLGNIRSLREFDDAYTAPLHGFDGAADYYRRASSKPSLSALAVPTLLLNAANDPFLPPSCYPHSIARPHDQLVLEVPRSGGHVGFVSFNDSGEYWSERRAASFLSPS
ncbi:YheT family hydrolase [Salinibacter grassmerensis]|uniref:YheT family hydrolase n=1 Tax=Salinibacter grassmerensis TaxID=3040353 RepID=UPI0021E6FC20|nr:alpha/beta fold hydrolase [Salinibacter grassmerensis]